MKIETNELSDFSEYLNKLQNRTKDIDDAIPFIKNEIESSNVNVKVELSTGVAELPKKNARQLTKLIEATSVLPVQVPKQPQQPRIIKTNNFSNNKSLNQSAAKQDAKVLRKKIIDTFMKWYLQK